ncbi:hypothetical protein [Saccharopolyspora hattusasensis]|uniref:hypothetical protein n=1 Tax=Saccharopolyspora hattusasensis TaxID=1128679 RepID=UPI003D95A75D
MGMIAYEDLAPGRVFDLGDVEVDRAEMLAFAEQIAAKSESCASPSSRCSAPGSSAERFSCS